MNYSSKVDLDLSHKLAEDGFSVPPGTTMGDPAAMSGEFKVPLLGYPGVEFWLIHAISDTTLGISVIASLAVLVYMHQQEKPFWKRFLFERLVAYIAVSDFLYSSAHAMDHTTMMVLRDHPGEYTCIAMGFLNIWFFVSQPLLVMSIAGNAALLVIFQKRLKWGRFDWKLLSFVFGVPLGVGILALSADVLGPSGAWCFFDMRNPGGPLYYSMMLIYQVCVILLMAVSYGGIWIKILRENSRNTLQSSQSMKAKYIKSAKVMTFFVLAYLFQYWPALVHGAYILVTPFLPVWVILCIVGIGNMGGVYNLITYTVILKQYSPRN